MLSKFTLWTLSLYNKKKGMKLVVSGLFFKSGFGIVARLTCFQFKSQVAHCEEHHHCQLIFLCTFLEVTKKSHIFDKQLKPRAGRYLFQS